MAGGRDRGRGRGPGAVVKRVKYARRGDPIPIVLRRTLEDAARHADVAGYPDGSERAHFVLGWILSVAGVTEGRARFGSPTP